MKVLYLHGWQSKPGGVKPTYLARHGHEVINPPLPDDDFDEAIRISQAVFHRHHPDVIVGSSRGAAVAMNIDSGHARLVLLCPAWKTRGTASTVKHGTILLHSETDDVVPIEDSRELMRKSRLPESALLVIGNDHRLADAESLATMLKAVEQSTARDLAVSHESSTRRPFTYILDLAKEAEPPADGIFSHTLHQDDRTKAVVFGLGQGQELSEHAASTPALLYFVKGQATLGLAGDRHDAQPGTWVHMPAELPHSIQAKTPLVMLLVLLK